MSVVTVNLIKTSEDYQAALKRLDEIFDAVPGTPEGDEAEVLTILISAYEDKHFPMEAVSPLSVIKYVMEQQGLKQVDLAPYMGGRSRVSEVLSGKRALTLEMIRNLSKGLHIPVEALVQL